MSPRDPLGRARVLAFPPHVRAVVDGEDRLFLVSEARHVLVRGRAVVRLTPLLDGTRTVGQILDALATELHPAVVVDALETLVARGHLVPAGELTVIGAADYLDPALEAWNREALATGRSWTLLKVGGAPSIGPIFRPGGPCWACLAHRVRANRPVERHLGVAAPRIVTDLPPVPADVPPDHVLMLRDGSTHRVTRRPQCPACGDATIDTRRAEAAVTLSPRPHRLFGADETWARLAHLVSPLSGVVASVGPMPGSETVYAAALFTSVPDDFQATSMGRGRTAAEARAGALAEAIERLSATFQGDEPRRTASLEELGDEAVDPDAVELSTGPRLDPRAKIEWTPCWSLTQGRRRWLPASLCYLGAPGPFTATSNGHGAGHTLEEAIFHGFLELVERDAVAIWWYTRARRPGLSLGGDRWALDLTHDLGIPVYAAVTRREGRWRLGFGAHLDARVALERATTELQQLEAVPAEPLPPIADDAYLRPDGAAATEGASPGDLRDCILVCVERAARAGLETIVLDQTRADLGLCAAKVVVPGLRHFWPRFAPGRLYDVPVRLGWRATPLAEADLNPVPLLL